MDFSRSALEDRQDTRSPSSDKQKALANVTEDKIDGGLQI